MLYLVKPLVRRRIDVAGLSTVAWRARHQPVAERQLPLVLATGLSPAGGLRSAVAVAGDLHDPTVMHQPVHRCHRHGTAGEDLLPGGERLVGGDRTRWLS